MGFGDKGGGGKGPPGQVKGKFMGKGTGIVFRFSPDVPPPRSAGAVPSLVGNGRRRAVVGGQRPAPCRRWWATAGAGFGFIRPDPDRFTGQQGGGAGNAARKFKKSVLIKTKLPHNAPLVGPAGIPDTGIG
eukprot:gene4263-3426_t